MLHDTDVPAATDCRSGGVDFHILGTFEIRVNGRSLEVTSPKHRILLTMLLVHAGRSVAVVELAEAIWGNDGPDDPQRAVQLYIARLRAIIRVAAPTISITTTPSAYRMDVEAASVDLGRFRSRLERARRAADHEDLELESSLLGEALAEWRGAPLADVPSDFLQREVVPLLVEERAQALERYFDVELLRGRHAEVIGELTSLTAHYPLRERLSAQLILALFRAGRRADALEAYHGVRRRLTDELGIDPGDELQTLHAAVLTGRTQPVADIGGAAIRSVPVPRQLPPDIPAFSGRSRELALLDSFQARDTGGVAIVSGSAGMGKTSLVAHWSRRVADQFPDGQLWVNLRGFGAEPPLRPKSVLKRLLRALGLPDDEIPAELDDRMGLYRSLMDGQQMLVVLDNARSPEQVRPLIPGSANTVIVTSRDQMIGLVAKEGAALVELGLPTRTEAGRMFADRIGAGRVVAESAAVDEIIELCARLPLALVVTAARAVASPDFPLSALAAEIRATRGSLDGFASLDEPTEVRAVFSWSYNALSDQAARLFRLLSLHPGPDVALNAAASTVGLAPLEVRPLLAELCTSHLVTEHVPGRYVFHDLLRAYGVELAVAVDTEASKRKAIRRLLDHYLGTALAATEHVELWEQAPSRPVGTGVVIDRLADAKDAHAWWDAEHAVLIAAIRQAVNEDLAEHAWLMSWAANEFLSRHGDERDWLVIARSALDLATSRGSEADQARGHRELARAYVRLSRFGDAEMHCRLALRLSERVGDQRDLARTHQTIGHLLDAQGRHHEALLQALRARDLFVTVGDFTGEARALKSISWANASLGDYKQAPDKVSRRIGASA
ncbi:BTAD domain-containing putative transcriptional regulator [Kribbella sp. NPDC049227]|uniref:AfsR/SARP family transcriptional regulator n=1 Tax=Kribbella sp. NPDC049227 TaxID=3364113 RepID=UPI00371EAC4C